MSEHNYSCAESAPVAVESREGNINATLSASTTGGEGGVKKIRLFTAQSRKTERKGRAPLTPNNPATVANSLGIPWSTATTSKDNNKSKKYGICLTQARIAQGIADFDGGDLVEIEVGLGEERFKLVGRASRCSTAYFWITELEAAGITIHRRVNLVIVGVTRVRQGTQVNGGAA